MERWRRVGRAAHGLRSVSERLCAHYAVENIRYVHCINSTTILVAYILLPWCKGIMGPYPPHVLLNGRDSGKYFTMNNIVYERDQEEGFQLILPKKTDLRSRLHLPPDSSAKVTPQERLNNNLFLDFVQKLLNLDPSKRLTAVEALRHPWLEDADRVEVGEYIIRQPGDFPPPPPYDDEEGGNDEDEDDFLEDDDEEDDDDDDEDDEGEDEDDSGFANYAPDTLHSAT